MDHARVLDVPSIPPEFDLGNTTSASGYSETPSIPISRLIASSEADAHRGRRFEGQQVRQHRAGIPVEVSKATLAVLQHGAPGDPGDHERDRCVDKLWVGRGRGEHTPDVATAQLGEPRTQTGAK